MTLYLKSLGIQAMGWVNCLAYNNALALPIMA